MQLHGSTYTDKNNSKYEIFTRFSRAVQDIECQLIRFQIYYKDSTYACDTLFPYRFIKKYSISEDQTEKICFQKVCRAIDNNIREYCSILIGKEDVEPYL